MKFETTAKRLKIALESADISQQELSDKSGVHKASISQYMNGKNAPSNISAGAMAEVLHVNPLWLMGFDVGMHDDMEPKKGNGVSIPVLGRVSAGIPIEAVEEILDVEEIPEAEARSGDFFALQIHGQSMEPVMHEGDVVIVRKQETAEDGDTVIVSVDGTDATCKILKMYEDGISLVSINPDYAPMYYRAEDVIEKPVTIWGKVVELRRKFE